MKYLRHLTYMTWGDVAVSLILLLGALLLAGTGLLAVAIGFGGWLYPSICFGAALLLGWATCVVVWYAVGMGRMYRWGIRFRKNKKGRRSA